MTCFIDIGHGKSDCGATHGLLSERDTLRKVLSPPLLTHLQQLHGVVLVPEITPLSARLQWLRGETQRNDLVISYHLNAPVPEYGGVEAFYAPGHPADVAIACRQLAELHAVYLGRPVRRVTEDIQRGVFNRDGTPQSLGICRKSGTDLAFVLEVGFLGHPEDYDAWISRGAFAVAQALAAFGVGR